MTDYQNWLQTLFGRRQRVNEIREEYGFPPFPEQPNYRLDYVRTGTIVQFVGRDEEFTTVSNPDVEKLTVGIKFDEGKLQYSLLPPTALAEVVKVFTKGAVKYAPYNWLKGMNYCRIYDAAQRHMNSWFMGEQNDPEMGTNHLANAIVNLLFLLTFELTGRKEELDDRVKGV